MPVKITICDDAAEDIASLAKALYSYDPSFEIATSTSGDEMLSETADKGLAADILFLDIYMPGLGGILTAQRIRTEKKELKIIFVSTSEEHYPEAYAVFAFNYILKPIDKKRLYAVLDRAIEELGRESASKISFVYKSASYSVLCRDIRYIESRDRLLLFHLADDRALQTYWRLDEVMNELPRQSFIRCHQSFIVNIAHITEMCESCFHIGSVPIGISRKYMKSAREQYYTYLFSRMGGGRTS